MAHMLIVDDSADNRDFCELIAHLYKIEVTQAENVDQAFKILEAGLIPSVILLDLVMPGRPPEELVEFVKHDPKLKDTKVVLTSALRELRMIADAMGADETLRKPYNMNEFVESFRKTSLINAV